MVPIPGCDPLLSSAAMRSADRRTIGEYGIPGLVLMESAGRAAARALAQRWTVGPGTRVTVACGPGNNGGDGFVVGRVLYACGASVTVVVAGDPERFSVESGVHYRALRRLADDDPARLTVVSATETPASTGFDRADLVVDALLGIGQTSAPRGAVADLVGRMNAGGRPIVAVDVPTGLDADTGVAFDPCVRAELTVTMGAAKIGMFLADGPSACGDTVSVEIGIPAAVAAGEAVAWRTTDAAVRALLRAVPRRDHKYASGPALVVGGSLRYTGAPVLAARAAARAGAGYVLCAAPERAGDRIAPALPDVPFVGLPHTEDGYVDGRAAADAVLERADRVRALLVGPGLGRGPTVTAFVRSLLERWRGPAVVDADALNAIDGAFAARHADGRWVLTPHAAEFERLGGSTGTAVPPTLRAAAAADAWRSVVVLKGYPTVAAPPGSAPYVGATGNPALATAGTGDVLAGLSVGMLARTLAPAEAAAVAVHLGGAAADRYASRCGRASMTATDLLAELGPVLHERFD